MKGTGAATEMTDPPVGSFADVKGQLELSHGQKAGYIFHAFLGLPD